MLNIWSCKAIPFVFVITAALFLSGCGKYATRKDLSDLQQKTQETNQGLNERLSKVEQAPKADPAELASLTERVNKISMYALELEQRVQAQALVLAQAQTQPQPQMTLRFKAVSTEDISGLLKKINELDGKLKNFNETKQVVLKSVVFPLGKVRVEDLSMDELSKLRENSVRIREEKPLTVEIITWADGSGTPDVKEKVAAERARNVESYYRENAGENAKIKFLTVFKVASAAGPLWRRAETTMWVTQELK